MNRVYIGIDPGGQGGLVSITIDNIDLQPMPDNERDIWDWISDFGRHGEKGGGYTPVTAIIEKVQGYIGEAQPGSSAFKFGMSYGGLRMALIAAGIPFEAVTPQTWQKKLGIPPRRKSEKDKETKYQFKSRLKAVAEKLYPKENITRDTADALLIAHYCKLVSNERGK